MTKAAADHTKDMGFAGKTGHVGTDGSNVFFRIKRYGKWKGGCGENLAYGPKTGKGVLLNLLIDDGVPDRSHR